MEPTMDNNQIWKISDTIHCQQLTSEYVEDVVAFIETAFFPHENVCITLGIAEDPEALKELRELTRVAVKDGVTIIAIDKTSKKLVGVAVNKIQVRNNPVFENFAESWKRPKSIAVVEFMAKIDNLCNLLDHCQIDCLFEQMYLGTSSEYRRQGIGKKLVEVSIEIAASLSKGINVKKSVDGTQLSLEPVPKIISSILTSTATQRIARDLGFQAAVEINYDELEFQGTRFSSVVERGTKKLTMEYKKL